MDVVHLALQAHLLAALQRWAGGRDQVPVQRVVEHTGRRLGAAPRRARLHLGHRQDVGEVDPARLPVLDRRLGLEQVGAPDQLLHRPHAQAGHQPPGVLGHQHQVVDDVLGSAGEPAAQLRVLRGDPHRAGVEVADPHHDAAGGDQRGGGEAELVGAEHGADHHVATGAHLAVDLDNDP